MFQFQTLFPLGQIQAMSTFAFLQAQRARTCGPSVQVQITVQPTTFATDVGDGVALSYTITHNLGTRDVLVDVYDNATFIEPAVRPTVEHTTANTLKLTFLAPPTLNQFHVVIQK